MIRKPIKAPKADWDDHNAVIYDVVIREQEEAPSDTGLIDIYGNSIYSFPESKPIGFIHF